MNAVLEVMQNCEAFGVKISVSGEKLKIDAPKGLPDSIKESLRQHKADIIRKLARDGETVNAPSLTAKISRMISEGVKFDISAADFQAFGTSERENVFLRENKPEILCTLQQMFLTKHLFSQSPELLEDFQTEVHERSAIMSDGGSENIFQALTEVCAEWITEAIENENRGIQRKLYD